MADTLTATGYRLSPFDPVWASTVASWVRDDEELFRLAPGTPPPITPAKVLNWTRHRGHAFVFTTRPDRPPVGYAELNPMQRDPTDLWIGHVLIDPERRGCGLGRALAEALVDHAFTEEHARRISLVVFPDNLVAIRCYLAAGMRQSGTERQVFGPRKQRYRLLRFERLAGQ